MTEQQEKVLASIKACESLTAALRDAYRSCASGAEEMVLFDVLDKAEQVRALLRRMAVWPREVTPW